MVKILESEDKNVKLKANEVILKLIRVGMKTVNEG